VGAAGQPLGLLVSERRGGAAEGCGVAAGFVLFDHRMDKNKHRFKWNPGPAVLLLGLPGILSAIAFILLLPLAITWCARLPWVVGAVALAPWWFLLARRYRVMAVFFAYFMPAFAFLGWLVLAVFLHKLGVF
jgi:hypothetical protein